MEEAWLQRWMTLDALTACRSNITWLQIVNKREQVQEEEARQTAAKSRRLGLGETAAPVFTNAVCWAG